MQRYSNHHSIGHGTLPTEPKCSEIVLVYVRKASWHGLIYLVGLLALGVLDSLVLSSHHVSSLGSTFSICYICSTS